MKILVVTYLYKPDKGPSVSLFAMLCERLVDRGHEVTVITTIPHYPSGITDTEYRNKWIQKSKEQGVQVIRVRIPSLNRQKLSSRLLQFLTFQVGASIACLKEEYDFAIVANPAINKGLPFFAVATLRNRPSIFLVADVYPDVGIETGVFKNMLVIRFVEAIEKYCLRNADIVWVLSESFVPRMKSMGVMTERLNVLGVWVDTDFFKPLPRQNSFSNEHSLNTKFVVLYAGNIGLSQGLENILIVADQLSEYPEIQFVFVGEGIGREVLIARAAEMKLGNVQFIPFQPWERVPEIMATADVSVVSLKSGIGVQSLPSKSFTYLASGRPILAIMDEDSAIWRLVEQSKSGKCVSFGNTVDIVGAILKLYHDPTARQTMGENARSWAVHNCSVYHAVDHVECMIQRAIAIHRRKGK